MDVVTPIIHLNGDRKDTLIALLRQAYKACRVALVQVQACVPNSRNYYPEPGRYEKALRQHIERADHLIKVIDSLAAEAEAIEVQYGNRG